MVTNTVCVPDIRMQRDPRGGAASGRHPDKMARSGKALLAFCKLAVEAHGGRITVDSVPGRGTTFTFSLPVAPGV